MQRRLLQTTAFSLLKRSRGVSSIRLNILPVAKYSTTKSVPLTADTYSKKFNVILNTNSLKLWTWNFLNQFCQKMPSSQMKMICFSIMKTG